MNIMMTPELETVRDQVARFMQTEVVPVMDDFEKRQVLPRELIQKAG
jgi:isovaleryl-CoA dehydrogenase